MTPELEHKTVETLCLCRVLMREIIQDHDENPTWVGREMRALRQIEYILKQTDKPVETTHETRTVQQQSAATPAGGDGK